MADPGSIRAVEDLEKLAEIILSNAKTIKGFFHDSGLPQLSLHKDAAIAYPPTTPLAVQAARRDLLDASAKISQLVTGPADHVIWLSATYMDAGCIRYSSYHRLAHAVPLDADISYADLAEKTTTNEHVIRRVLRYLMTKDIFTEPRPGYVAHTAGSKVLTIPGPGDMADYAATECLPMAANMVETIQKFGYSEEPNETAYNYGSGSEKPIFIDWSNDPVRGPRFARSMTAMQATPAYNIQHTLNGYDWASLPVGSTIVDIGGSVGQCAKAIASVAPNPKFIVQDLASTIEEAKATPLPPELEGRIEFQVHDFYTPEPVQGADIYIFRFILHNYSDKYTVKLISNVLSAMKPGHSKLVIIDQIMPPVGTISITQERMLRFMDMQMLSMLNAKERELSEWGEVAAQASDGKLKITKVSMPEGSALGVLELSLEE